MKTVNTTNHGNRNKNANFANAVATKEKKKSEMKHNYRTFSKSWGAVKSYKVLPTSSNSWPYKRQDLYSPTLYLYFRLTKKMHRIIAQNQSCQYSWSESLIWGRKRMCPFLFASTTIGITRHILYFEILVNFSLTGWLSNYVIRHKLHYMSSFFISLLKISFWEEPRNPLFPTSKFMIMSPSIYPSALRDQT